jgi:ribosomal protein L7Ae-like RNA K-turn-binding protein
LDTEKINKRILGMLGLSSKAGKIVCGTDATIGEIERHKVTLIIVAEDASEKTKKNIKFICEKNNVKIIEFGKIDEISKVIGKNNKAIIGIKSKSLSDGILKLVEENGGDLLHG